MNKIREKFAKFNRKIHTATMKGTEKNAVNFVNELKRELIIQNLIDTGELLDSIDYRRLNMNEYGILMKRYGIALDRMRPHWVSLIPGRRITEWYERTFGETSGISREIFVRPHPWIENAFIRSVKQVRPIMENEINKFIKETFGG